MVVASGKVQVSYNLGKQGNRHLFVLESSTTVSDGQWHVAFLDRLVHYQRVFVVSAR